MAKRPKPLEPVTVGEVEQAVLKTLATAFGDRPLDVQVAKQGLSHAGWSLTELHLKDVAERANAKAKKP